jgi:hypothetical protein
VFADEFVTIRTLAACELVPEFSGPVQFVMPPGDGVLMIATGSEVLVCRTMIWPDEGEITYA